MRPPSVYAKPSCPATGPCDLLRLLHGPHRVGCRLVMILLSQQGLAAADIAGLLGYDPSTVRRWIHRYREHGATGLADRSRSGRPRLGSPRLHQRIRRLLAEPKAWTIGRLWKRLGRPAISVRTLHRRVREVACWRRPGRQHGPQLPGRAPEPADPPVCLALVRQGREQVRPIPGRLGQEPGLAAPAWQMPHQRNRQQLGVTAGRRRTRPGPDGDGARADRVID